MKTALQAMKNQLRKQRIEHENQSHERFRQRVTMSIKKQKALGVNQAPSAFQITYNHDFYLNTSGLRQVGIGCPCNAASKLSTARFIMASRVCRPALAIWGVIKTLSIW